MLVVVLSMMVYYCGLMQQLGAPLALTMIDGMMELGLVLTHLGVMVLLDFLNLDWVLLTGLHLVWNDLGLIFLNLALVLVNLGSILLNLGLDSASVAIPTAVKTTIKLSVKFSPVQFGADNYFEYGHTTVR